MGIAVSQGKIKLTDSLDELGIDDIEPALSDDEKTATVQDLMEARSGVYHLAADDTPSMVDKRPERGANSPGAFWYYNNWDFNALGGIYEQKTGTSIFKALYDQIAVPVGMQDYQASDSRYSYQKNFSKYPGYLMKLSTRDMARFGQLYLQNGKWNDTQVIPEKWIRKSLTSYSDASGPAGTGYGYLWWLGTSSGGLFNGVNLGAGAFAAEGYGGHYLIGIPSLSMVVVTRADDAWFNEDAQNRSIGLNREGKLLAAILASQLQ